MVDSQSEIVDFDAEAALAAVRAVAGTDLYTFVEFDADCFNTLFVSDAAEVFYEDAEEMQAHFAEIHSYVHLDLVEQDLFTNELFPIANRVRYVSTTMDYLSVVRVYVDGEGIFFAVEDDDLVPELVETIEDSV
jgi:hypothetical protein